MYMLDHSKKLLLEADLTPEEADLFMNMYFYMGGILVSSPSAIATA